MPFTEWETPQDFFDEINKEFHFHIDVCAVENNAKLPIYFTPKINAFNQDWIGNCWCNPPYDSDIGAWMKKAYESAQKGSTVVCLIQGRSSDTVWWHDYVMRATEIRYIKNRLHFGKNGVFTRANISNILVIFRPFCNGSSPRISSILTNGKPYKFEDKQPKLW